MDRGERGRGVVDGETLRERMEKEQKTKKLTGKELERKMLGDRETQSTIGD